MLRLLEVLVKVVKEKGRPRVAAQMEAAGKVIEGWCFHMNTLDLEPPPIPHVFFLVSW